MTSNHLFTLPFCLALSSLLMACSPTQTNFAKPMPQTNPSQTAHAPSTDLSALMGSWHLVSGDLPSSAYLSFVADDDLLQNQPNQLFLSGGVGCNQLSVPVAVMGNTLTPQAMPISTLMACDNPTDEQRFADFFAHIKQYELTGDSLTLTSSNSRGDTQATFHRTPLQQTWQLIDAIGFDTPLSDDDMTSVVLDFSQTNSVYATAGCNALTFGFHPQTSQFDRPTSTRMACTDVPAESLLITFLPSVNRYTIKQQQLILTNKAGQRLIFAPKTP